MFWPQAQFPRGFSYFVIRTEGDPGVVSPLVAERIHEVDPDIQVGPVQDYDSLLRRRLVQPRFNMFLTAIFSGLALILAGVGIYGVVSRAVATRTREIGLRIALGAPQTRVVREVVGRSLRLSLMGVAAGLALALVLSRFIRSLLHGVAPNDPLTYSAVALILFGVSLLASLAPALSASRADPMETLRQE